VAKEGGTALLVRTLQEQRDKVRRAIDILQQLIIGRIDDGVGSMSQVGGMHWQRLLIPSSLSFARPDATRGSSSD
jgi:predicted transcriptional regulator